MNDSTQICLLRLRVESSLYDELTDQLLAFPARALDFIAMPINRHHGDLRTMNERVSGYQSGYEFQVECSLEECEQIDCMIQQQIHASNYELSITPMIQPHWRS